MKVTINNQTFDLNPKQVATLRIALGINEKQLCDIAIGDTFKIADIEFIKFTEENGVACAVAKDILFNTKFDDKSNNFANSSLLKRLEKDVLTKVENEIGSDNVLEFETDLISLDGLDDYGVMKSKISLPTFDFYRKHVKIFDRYKINNWWWLSTPDSTPTHSVYASVRVVYYGGTLDTYYCSSGSGVRPFLTFKSSISVSY